MATGVNRIRVANWLLWLRFLKRGGAWRLRCIRKGRLSGRIQGTAEAPDDPTADGSARCRICIAGTGFAALFEHFFWGARATSQGGIPGF
ncbi:hypothetical protein ASF36_19010 [Methylobacterium sp. Leaf90]|nr:hypothetical protein [Methylorubrum zatmanii]ARO57101.1 hypothetical protein B2G69_25000 [Methylorubrum zatmanii]KQO91631.1 hypothetical protein ASF36_19010 [Methylobacterium sp. Leaf90]